MQPGCPVVRGAPPWRLGRRRALPPLLLLRVAILGVQPTTAVSLAAGLSWPAGLASAGRDDDGEVLRGNGDDLPGFGTYRTRGKREPSPRPSNKLELGEPPPETMQLRLKPHAFQRAYKANAPVHVVRSYHTQLNDVASDSMKRFLFFLSICIAFCGSTLTVMGMVLQKYAHQKQEEEAEVAARTGQTIGDCDKDNCPMERHCYLFNWRWILGLAVFGAGNAVTWVALGMGPNSVLACFNSWNIVFSMVVAPMWFGEQVTSTAKLSAVVLIGGCIWVTIVGPRSYRLHTIDSINMLFARFPFTLCCIACFTILVAAKIKHWFWRQEPVWSASASVQITSMASIFACYAVLFSKCTSMLVQSSVATNVSQVGNWQFYLWAGATLVCGICQIYFLNESLRHGLASFVIPAYESMGMAMQIIVGGIFFREYRKFTLAKHMTFWPGVLLVLSGLIFLTRSTSTQVGDGTSARSPEEAVASGTDTATAEKPRAKVHAAA